ncbi:hypothetical protein HDU76_001095 [Blyttiomyces sp. JEL0837]|nr:hypothetical protein HDU76_001095 [Blyttiomyces sp. JEL0837]
MLTIKSFLQWSKNKKRNDTGNKHINDDDHDDEQPQLTIPSRGSSLPVVEKPLPSLPPSQLIHGATDQTLTTPSTSDSSGSKLSPTPELPYMGSYYEHCVECIAFGPNEVLDLKIVKETLKSDDQDVDENGDDKNDTLQIGPHGFGTLKMGVANGVAMKDYLNVCQLVNAEKYKVSTVKWCGMSFDDVGDIKTYLNPPPDVKGLYIIRDNNLLDRLMELLTAFVKSNWGNRVWTLQEACLPPIFKLAVKLYDANHSKEVVPVLFDLDTAIVQASRSQMLGGEGMDWATLKYALATRDSRFVEDRVYGALGLLRNKQHIHHQYGINLSLLDTQVAWHTALELGENILRSADWSFMFGAFPELTKKTKINPKIERVDHGLKVDARIIKVSDKGTASEDVVVPTESSSDLTEHDRENYQMDIITDEDWNASLRWMTILLKRCSGVEDWETARRLAGGLIRALKETARFEWLYSSWDRVNVADWCNIGWTDPSEEFETKKLRLDVFKDSHTPGDTVGVFTAKSSDKNVNQRFLFKHTHPTLPIGRIHCKESDLVLEIEPGKQQIQAVPDPDFGRVEQLFDLRGCFLKNGKTIKKKGGRILVGGMPLEVCGNVLKNWATVTLGDLIAHENGEGKAGDNTTQNASKIPAKQTWLLKDIGISMNLPHRSLFQFIFQLKGTCLDVAWSSLKIGDKVGVFSAKPYDRNTNQRFGFEPISPNSNQGFLKCIVSNLYLQLEPDTPLIQTTLDKTKKSQLFDLSECFNGNGEIVPGRILVDGKAMEVTHLTGTWVYLEGMVLDEIKRRLDVFGNSKSPGSTVGIWTPNDDDNCENQKFVFKPIDKNITTTADSSTKFIGRLQCVNSQLYLQSNIFSNLTQTNLDERDVVQIFDLSRLIKVNPSDGSREFTTGKIYVNGYCMGVIRQGVVGVTEEVEVEQQQHEFNEPLDESFPELGKRFGSNTYPWNQLWLIEQASKRKHKNNFIITVPQIGHCLDVHNNALDADAEVGIWTRNSVDNIQNQRFAFRPLDPSNKRPTVGYLQCVESQLYLELTQTAGLLQTNQRIGNKCQIFDLSECIKCDEETGERSFVLGRILVTGFAMEVSGRYSVGMADPEAVVDEEEDDDKVISDIPPAQLWHLTQESSASIEVESLIAKLDTSLFWNSPQGVWMHESAFDAGDDAWVVLADVKDEIGTWVGADLLDENGERAGITLPVRTEGVVAEGWHREGTALFAVREKSAEAESVVLGIKVAQKEEQPEK